ncbi:hypothetical protein COW36_23085 [bacterium (Candidatus Blackallbacteria) CG17_big_fil_post_rev_8_21_14_2_50_48_46]|uniref:Uncharacterized protein n=1 Tax=bacterium (Candidatus Blackallbacteria) CG17_big_fil_post_rev_8_21_14_2_50_48_46 TaxID=2014261 RepID=A0A2M7FYL8_9BACT|nr:MAG: hypothetical protein COW64_16155 [bacterium (Candidatus Blackallbacteria) CG18_big_fil_WC_8_21_14_2_50_49_26]PIW14136.1 MAG: hypothetical protein COW36_23085 [bacterium (Candidatus Blackallbacteria) CG17_big_fil_post_rev_8_21_14_2_50_48_46]PIW45866.1 MAG: hypothetical protein COW20_18750 [bacterium (Candidatus Blackallbacteria) CG13_big_fil_rev_8_21_14_2_50_49_14]
MSEQNEKTALEKLPVNIREISQTQHIILRLEQLQRMVIKEPKRFHELDSDRSLNHIRSEVKELQSRLRITAVQEVMFELKVLNEATDLLSNWEEEKELADVLIADRHTREMLMLRNRDELDYPGLLQLADDVRQVRLKMFNKYKGYFSSLLQDNEEKRKLVERQLQQTHPKIIEYQEKSEQIQKIHGLVLGYHQAAMNALVGGLGILTAMSFGAWWFWKWWGLFPGLFFGYIAFSNISHHHAYVTGKSMEHLYEFLKERYEMKNVRPFFKYEDEKEKDKPTHFDCSRGESLGRFLHKDLLIYQQAFNVQERRKEEFVNYLTYLDGRTSWVREQHDRMERLEKLRKGDKLPERNTKNLPPAPPPLPPVAEPETPNLATALGLRSLSTEQETKASDSEVLENAPGALPDFPEEEFLPIPTPKPEQFAQIPPPPAEKVEKPNPKAEKAKPKFQPKPIKVLRKASKTPSVESPPPPEEV